MVGFPGDVFDSAGQLTRGLRRSDYNSGAQWAAARRSQILGSNAPKPKTNAKVQQAMDWAEQDRQMGLQNYQDDRNRFYEGQGQHNDWQVKTYDQNLDWINQDRARYAERFQPMEDRVAELADPSAAQYGQAYSRANADVAQQFAGQREQLARQLARYGLNPNSGRGMAMMGNLAMGEALAQTQARAQAADQVTGRADDMLQFGLNLGQQYRSTQQIAGPDIRYDVMGPRQANGLEATFGTLANSEADRAFRASEAAKERALRKMLDRAPVRSGFSVNNTPTLSEADRRRQQESDNWWRTGSSSGGNAPAPSVSFDPIPSMETGLL